MFLGQNRSKKLQFKKNVTFKQFKEKFIFIAVICVNQAGWEAVL